MVRCHDLSIEKVERIMSSSLSGILMGKSLRVTSLKTWLVKHWFTVLGYIPKFHIFMIGWIYFVLRGKVDVDNVLNQEWFLGLSSM